MNSSMSSGQAVLTILLPWGNFLFFLMLNNFSEDDYPITSNI